MDMKPRIHELIRETDDSIFYNSLNWKCKEWTPRRMQFKVPQHKGVLASRIGNDEILFIYKKNELDKALITYGAVLLGKYFDTGDRQINTSYKETGGIRAEFQEDMLSQLLKRACRKSKNEDIVSKLDMDKYADKTPFHKIIEKVLCPDPMIEEKKRIIANTQHVPILVSEPTSSEPVAKETSNTSNGAMFGNITVSDDPYSLGNDNIPDDNELDNTENNEELLVTSSLPTISLDPHVSIPDMLYNSCTGAVSIKELQAVDLLDIKRNQETRIIDVYVSEIVHFLICKIKKQDSHKKEIGMYYRFCFLVGLYAICVKIANYNFNTEEIIFKKIVNDLFHLST